MSAATTTPRPELTRRADDRIVAGVCSGAARWLGIDLPLLRLIAAGSCAIGGLGLLVYVAAAVALPAAPGDPDRAQPVLRRAAVHAGVALQLAGAALLLSAIGLAPEPLAILVATLAAAGGGLLWRAASGTGAVDPDAPRARVAAVARVTTGLLLLAIGAALSLRPSGLGSLGVAVVVAAAVAGGGALLLGPSLTRARREARHERAERIRADERAAVAARLHDSVLQTFAVIQHMDDASPRVRQLARSQERDLRAWLYAGEDVEGPATFAAAMRAAVRTVEELHDGVAFELVQSSDAPLSERTEALVAAAGEAMMNAARHSGAETVSVLARATPQELSVFVRDRGCGFDPAAVPEDRRGIRDSIVGRLERAGGHARLTSTPGDGTEVELLLPRDGGRSPA